MVEETFELLKEYRKGSVVKYYKYSGDFQRFSLSKKLIALIKGNIPFYVPGDFKQMLEREKPEVALIHNLIPLINIWILKELRKRKIRVIYNIHNYRIFCPKGTCFLKDGPCVRCFDKTLLFCIFYNCLNNFIYSLLYTYRTFLQRLFLGYIDLFTLPSHFTMGFFKRRLFKKNMVILKEYIYILEDLKNRKKEKKEFVIFAGRLVKEKGIFIILELAKLLKDIHFKICGEGPLMKYSQNLANERNLENVEFLGLVERKYLLELIKDARILIFPSLWYEVYPRITIETMLLGTPVIASKIGANKEYIEHCKTGFLFEPDDIESLADMTKRLWNDGKLRDSITKEAYRKVEGADEPEKYLENLLETCQSLTTKNEIGRSQFYHNYLFQKHDNPTKEEP